MKMIEINSERLKKAITEDMGLSLVEASEYIGYSSSYLGNVIKNGKLPERVAKMIENQLGIGLDEILLKEEKKPADEGLADVVEKAVYDAIIKALGSEEMNRAIYSGMRGALFEIEQKKAEKYFHR